MRIFARVLIALVFVLVLLTVTSTMSLADGPVPPPTCDPFVPPDPMKCPSTPQPVQL